MAERVREYVFNVRLRRPDGGHRAVMPLTTPEGPPFLRARLPLKIWAPILLVAIALIAGLSVYLAPVDEPATTAGSDDDVTELGETGAAGSDEAVGSGNPTVFGDPNAFIGDPIHFFVKVGEVVDPYSVRVLSPDASDLDLLVVYNGNPPVVEGDMVEVEGVVGEFTSEKVEEVLGSPVPAETFEASTDEVALIAHTMVPAEAPKDKGPVELAAAEQPAPDPATVTSDAASVPAPTYYSEPTYTAPPSSEPDPGGSSSSGGGSTSTEEEGGSGGGGSTSSDEGSDESSGSGEPATPQVTFTDRSATSGQYSDQVTLAARLVDGSGDAIKGAKLTFRFGSSTESSKTDERGIASVTPVLTEQPGVYELVVERDGARRRVSDEIDLEILKEETALDLTAEESEGEQGKDGSTLTAELVDPDSSAAIADRTIEFFADGELIGTATTDQNGIATIEVPPRYKNEDELEARFSVDDFYLTSADTV